MSRIGKRKLQIPTGVEASLNCSVFTAKSGKGTLELNIDPLVTVTITDGVIETTPVNESPRANVIVGTMNYLIVLIKSCKMQKMNLKLKKLMEKSN